MVVAQDPANNHHPGTLTDRERQVLRLLVQGYSFSDAARELHLPVTEVECSLSSISSKLHLSDRSAVQKYAVAIGLLNRNGRP